MADYQYLTSSGTIVPDTATLSDTVVDEYRAALGTDLIVTANTPQGVLITAETLTRDAVVRNNADLANQINPNISGGVFLDAIMALTGAERLPDEYTVVYCQVTGQPHFPLPAGSQAKTSGAGDIFESLGTVSFDGAGGAQVQFQALEPGPIPAPAGTLTSIVSGGVLGWETVTNAADGVLGQLTASDVEARAFRRNTLALQGTSLPVAITSTLYATPGVKSLQFRENVTDSTATIDGVSLLAKSIWVCVDGGSDAAIATALLEKKSGGANWNGAVTVNIIEPSTGQSYPVKFDRPTLVPVVARITVRANAAVVDPQTAVRAAVLDYANGKLEGEPGFTVGTSVSPFELGGAVNREQPGIYVQKVEVSLASSIVYNVAEIAMAIYQQATINDDAITVVTL